MNVFICGKLTILKIANETKYYPLDVGLTESYLLYAPTLNVPVVCHVTLDQVPGCQSGHERELSGQDGGADDAGQLSSVLPGAVLTGSLHTQHLKTPTKEAFNICRYMCR